MGREQDGLEPWDRRRLLRTLVAVSVAGVLGLVGVAYAVYGAVAASSRPAAATAIDPESRSSGPARRDAIAAAPMLAVPPAAARGGTPSTEAGPAIAVPAAGRVGSADIATGFPQTPEGAVGQLAAIEAAALQGMSIETATALYEAWSEPGAPPASQWELIANIQAFLASNAGSKAGPGGALVVATPVAGRVKGSDGTDWVVACVLMDVQAKVATTARIAYGHCERMQWDDGRWVIGAGAAPARAPSTWPGTDLARRGGWATWATAESGERGEQ